MQRKLKSKVKPSKLPELPKTATTAMKTIKRCTINQLQRLGFAQWDKAVNGKVLMLIPGNWYNLIPNGTIVHDISLKREKFKKGVSDNDTRFGCLPYGIMKAVK